MSTDEGLLKRIYMFLEDRDFVRANEYCERMLDDNPENVKVYVAKLCAELKITTEKGLVDHKTPLTDMKNYKRALQFADNDYRTILEEYNEKIINRIEQERNNRIENQPEKKPISGIWVLIALFLFFPLGIYLLFKKKREESDYIQAKYDNAPLIIEVYENIVIFDGDGVTISELEDIILELSDSESVWEVHDSHQADTVTYNDVIFLLNRLNLEYQEK